MRCAPRAAQAQSRRAEPPPAQRTDGNALGNAAAAAGLTVSAEKGRLGPSVTLQAVPVAPKAKRDTQNLPLRVLRAGSTCIQRGSLSHELSPLRFSLTVAERLLFLKEATCILCCLGHRAVRS